MQTWNFGLAILCVVSFIPLSVQADAAIGNMENCSVAEAPRDLSSFKEDGVRALAARQPYSLAEEILWFLRGYEPPVYVLLLTSTLASVVVLRHLVNIYKIISNLLLDAWASHPPRNQIVIEAGSFRWEFGCTHYPIPRAFMDEYMKSKLDAVDRGFAPLYAKEWWFTKSDKTRWCYAAMQVERDDEILPPLNNTLQGL